MKRIYFLDVAKAITAFLVVFAHLYPKDSAVRIFIYSFHMPLFFIISGVFHHKSDTVKLSKYIKTILYPAVIFLCLSVLFIPPIRYCEKGGTYIENLYFIVHTLLSGFVHGKDIGNVIWFLFALFWCKIFTDIISHINNGKVALALTLLLSFLCTLRFPLLVTNALMALPFYYFGFVFQSTIKSLKPTNKTFALVLLCLTANILLTLLNGRVSMVGIKFGNYGSLSIPLFYLNGLIGSMTIILGSLFVKHNIAFITKISLSLITILGIQEIFIRLYNTFIGYDNNWFVLILLAISYIVIAVYVDALIKPVLKIWDRHR